MVETVWNSLVHCHWILSCLAASAAIYRYARCSWLTLSDLLCLSSGFDTSQLPTLISLNLSDVKSPSCTKRVQFLVQRQMS